MSPQEQHAGTYCQSWLQKSQLIFYVLAANLMFRAYRSTILIIPTDLMGNFHGDLFVPTPPSKTAIRRRTASTNLADYYTINDKTITMNPNVIRLWIDQRQPQPSYKLLLTDVGWNHPNATVGLTHTRCLRSRELLQGVVDHPHFDASLSWSGIANGTVALDPDTNYFVFFDVETCFESNYPYYGGRGDPFHRNSDLAANRTYTSPYEHQCFNVINCRAVREVLDTVHKFPRMILVIYNCRGWGPGPRFRREVPSRQLSIVSESVPDSQALAELDMGLTPGPLNVVNLTDEQIQAIHDCKDVDRPFLSSFIGAPKYGPREALMFNISKTAPKDMVFVAKQDFQRDYFFLTFHEMLRKTMFGATPRGDNLYSYRFTEVLSAGSIPVVHSDGWVLPFHPALFDWNATCAVVIPESEVLRTESILRGLSQDERCRRQRNCLEIYQKYFVTAHGTVRGIVEALRRIQEQRNVSALAM